MKFLFFTLSMYASVTGADRIKCVVESLTLTRSKPGSLTASWTVPPPPDCPVWGYSVSLIDEKQERLVEAKITRKTRVQFINLDGCTRFKVEVKTLKEAVLGDHLPVLTASSECFQSSTSMTKGSFPLKNIAARNINTTAVFVSWTRDPAWEPCADTLTKIRTVMVRGVPLQGRHDVSHDVFKTIHLYGPFPAADNVTVDLAACAVYNISVSVLFESRKESLDQYNTTVYTYPSSYTGAIGTLTASEMIDLCYRQLQTSTYASLTISMPTSIESTTMKAYYSDSTETIEHVTIQHQQCDCPDSKSSSKMTITAVVLVCCLLIQSAFIVVLKTCGIRLCGRRWLILGVQEEPPSGIVIDEFAVDNTLYLSADPPTTDTSVYDYVDVKFEDNQYYSVPVISKV